MSDSFATPRTVACQAPLSMGFPRQEYLSALPFPSPGELLNPGIEPMSPELGGGFFITGPPRKLVNNSVYIKDFYTLITIAVIRGCPIQYPMETNIFLAYILVGNFHKG